MKAKRTVTFALAGALSLTTFASTSQAALAVFAAPATGGQSIWITLTTLSLKISFKNIFKRSWLLVVDPTAAIQSFQLDVSYDPNRMQFESVEFISPYIQSGQPDLSVPGIVQGVAGQSVPGLPTGNIETMFPDFEDIPGQPPLTPPPVGDVNIFALEFDDLLPNSNDLSYFTVFAGGGDYVIALDPDTGADIIIPPDAIIPLTVSTAGAIPEPSSMAVFLAALALGGGAALLRSNRRSTVS